MLIMSDSNETSETTPVIGGEGKNAMKQKISNKLHKTEDNYKKLLICSCMCGTMFITGIVSLIVWYYVSVFEDRDIMDQKEVVVSEQWLDYTSSELSNCTNTNPCRNFDCEYVRQHFHKTPDECEYEDHIIIVSVLLGLWACSAIKGSLSNN